MKLLKALNKNLLRFFSFFFLFLLFSLISSLTSLASAASHSTRRVAPWIQNIQTLSGSGLTVTPDYGHVSIINAIKNARSSIQMEIYHLTDPEIINQLINAKARGCTVEIIFDIKSLDNIKYKTIFDQLQSSGIKTFKSSPLFSITHSKTFLIDNNLLFISTMNFVGHFQSMRDIGLFTKDVGLILEWQKIFRADLNNSKLQTNETPQIKHPNLLVSPFNAEQKLADLINSAQFSIELTVENLGNPTILDALKAARLRGVRVQTITPQCDLNSNPQFNYPFLIELEKVGVENHLSANPSSPQTPYMHQKMIIIDARLTFLGSENFSINSLRAAREIGVVFSSPELVRITQQLFVSDWVHSIQFTPNPTNACPSFPANFNF
jgi:phosphatidylserine/phosphatidylglycerophosphate/cardiolipin synthase-like enzyme